MYVLILPNQCKCSGYSSKGYKVRCKKKSLLLISLFALQQCVLSEAGYFKTCKEYLQKVLSGESNTGTLVH